MRFFLLCICFKALFSFVKSQVVLPTVLCVKDSHQYLAKYLPLLDTTKIKSHIEYLADTLLEGRESGERGQYLAGLYLKSQLQSYGLEPAFKDKNQNTSYFQPFVIKRTGKPTYNVGGVLKGSEKPNEFIVISAHYDHLGRGKAGVYCGADDNASGTAALLEMARVFALMKNKGFPPKKSLLFLFFSAEEKGLLGSEFFVENSPFPLTHIQTDLNVDMIGRVDEAHAKDTLPYVYIIGSNFISDDLHNINEQMNEQYVQLKLDYKYNNKIDPQRLYYRSDHYQFAKNDIPVIFYFSGLHEDYHKVTDTPSKIQYPKTLKITQLIFATAYYLAYHDVVLKKK